MGRLNFKDIKDWTPSSISVVDKPDHPLAVFEVYEDDEEFVKKSIDISKEGLVMSEQNVEVNAEEGMVTGPVSFFEKLFARNSVVTKSTEPTEPPEKPPEKNEGSGVDKILAKLDEMDKKIEGIDERVTKLEGGEDPGKPPEKNDNNDDPVPGVVTKNEGDTTSDPTGNVVTKSREVDPDQELVITKSEKTRMERMGRNSNGMTW